MISSRQAPLFASGLRLLPLFALVAAMLWTSSAHAAEKLKIIVPDKDNLQHLAFWVAKAGGSFQREGIDLEVVVAPPAARGTAPIDGALAKGEVDGAVAAPPVYLRLIAAKAEIVLVANLFANDPYAIVVRPAAVATRNIPEGGPVRDRLVALKGAAIVVPPAAFGRLRALLASQGLDLDKDLAASPLLARDQATPFKKATTEAAYLATPLLEQTIVAGDAVVVVTQARAEVPELANRQTQVMLVTRQVWTDRREVANAAVRAIADAERRIHAAQREVVDELAREFPARDRRELETIVRLYEPAVPQTPEVRAQDLAPALALIPESVPRPELAGIDLASFVAPEGSKAAASSPPGGGGGGGGGKIPWLGIALGALVLFGVVAVVRRRRGKGAI